NINDLEFFALFETLRQLRRLDFPDRLRWRDARGSGSAQLVIVHQLGDLARPAGRALRIPTDLECAERHRHRVKQQQSANEGFAESEQELDRLGGLDRTD